MAQTIWRHFQKQIKKIFVDAPSNKTSKKKVKFLLPLNIEEEENNSTTETDYSVNEKDNKEVILKTDTRRKQKKKRPPGMRAIEMLAEAAEKALKDAEEKNLKNCPLSNEVPSASVSAAFPSLKVSTTQSHSPFLLARCLGTSDKSTSEQILENANSPNLTEDGFSTADDSSKQQEHNHLIKENQDDQHTNNMSTANQPSVDISDIILTNQDAMKGEHSLPSNNDKSYGKKEKFHSPLILYLSADSVSHAAKGKENISLHNYASTETSELVALNHKEVDLQSIQNLEKAQSGNTMMSHVSSLPSTSRTVEATTSGYLKEAPENGFPPESILKSFFAPSQERTEIQQSIDANILNSSPLLEMADRAVKLANEEHVHSGVTTNERSLQENGLHPSLASQQYIHPINQLSPNSKSPQNEIPPSRNSPSFNQFLTNEQHSLSEHGISTVPQQMMIARYPNHLIPHSNFPNTDGRNIPSSTAEQIIPSQQYMCHPASMLSASSPYQALSVVNNSKDQLLHPLTPSLNLVLLPTSSTQSSISNESKVSASKETQGSEQANIQQNKLATIVPSHMVNTTSQNCVTPGYIFPGSTYPSLTTAESSIGFMGRPLGIPVTSSPAKEWNMMNNNYSPVTVASSIHSHTHSHPAALKHPPIILQKQWNPVISHSSKLINGQQSNKSTINCWDQASLLGSASTPTSKVNYQTAEVSRVGEENVNAIIPSPFHYPSSAQANSQYLLESLEPAMAPNFPNNASHLFPYTGEKFVATQNLNAFYPSHLIGSIGMPTLMNSPHTGPIITSGRNHQSGIPPILVPNGKQVGDIDSLKSTTFMPMQHSSLM